MHKYLLVFYFLATGCTKEVALRSFQYGLFSDADSEGKDMIALTDGSMEESAKTNCEAIANWHKTAYPNITGLHCRKLK